MTKGLRSTFPLATRAMAVEYAPGCKAVSTMQQDLSITYTVTERSLVVQFLDHKLGEVDGDIRVAHSDLQNVSNPGTRIKWQQHT